MNELNHPRWTSMWTAGVPAGAAFDALCPCPALVKLIADGCVPPGRTLVPGCGRGYDVAALVAKDRNVLGLDIAPLAIDAARKHACEVALKSYWQTSNWRQRLSSNSPLLPIATSSPSSTITPFCVP